MVVEHVRTPVYYYPAKLLLESKSFKEPSEDTKKNSELSLYRRKWKFKHTLDYSFPAEFEKVDN